MRRNIIWFPKELFDRQSTFYAGSALTLSDTERQRQRDREIERERQKCRQTVRQVAS